MKITVTTSVRIETTDGDATTVSETVRDSYSGDSPTFTAFEVCRVLTVANERVVDRLGGEEAARRRPLNAVYVTDYASRIYGPPKPSLTPDPGGRVTCYWSETPHVREPDQRLGESGCGWRTLHTFHPTPARPLSEGTD